MIKRVLLLAAIVVAISGCKKETIIRQGDVTDTFIYNTDANSWATTDGGYTWTAALQVPEINNDVLDNGAVLVYLVYNNSGGTFQEQVPTYYPGDQYTISALISAGYIDLFYESANNDPLSNPGVRSFKIVMLYGSAKKGYEPAPNEKLVKTSIKK